MLRETIADNVGLKAAYDAYRRWSETYIAMIIHNEDTTKRFKAIWLPLPVLRNFTHNQLFFLSFSQSWCSLATYEGRNNHLNMRKSNLLIYWEILFYSITFTC